MEIELIVSYAIGLLIGLVMGLIGGGGSVVLPTFIYLLKINEILATAYTLLLVGVTAIFGAVPRVRAKQVDFASVVTLGIPIFIGTMIVRYGIQHVPENLFSIGSVRVTRQMAILLIFASILLLSFASMAGFIGKNLKPRTNFRKDSPVAYYVTLMSCGLLIGLISATVGAGGGVMIVPLLVLVMGVEMKTVIGTSLTIMAIKSPVSFFLSDAITLRDQIDWWFLLTFGSIMIVGAIIGSRLAKRVDSDSLKKGFAWFILLMACYIFIKEIFFGAPTEVEAGAALLGNGFGLCCLL